MAQIVEIPAEVHFKVHPEVTFETSRTELAEVASTWIGVVIEENGFTCQHGGGAGGYNGLNERLTEIIADNLPHCNNSDACHMGVYARTGSTNDDNLIVELDCGVIKEDTEKKADEKAAQCAAHHQKCKDALGIWLTEAVVTISEARTKIAEAEKSVQAEKDIIRELT